MKIKNQIIMLLFLSLLSCNDPSNTKGEKNNHATDTLINGEHKEFYDNGKIKTLKNYSEGILDGSFRKYYPNGIMLLVQEQAKF